MLNDKDVPLIHENIRNFDAIALNCGRAVVSGQNPIYHLILRIDVTLKASISFRKAIEQNREIHWIKLEQYSVPLVHVLSRAALG